MTTTFLGSITRFGVLLDEDVMVYVDLPNSADPVAPAAGGHPDRARRHGDRRDLGRAPLVPPVG